MKKFISAFSGVISMRPVQGLCLVLLFLNLSALLYGSTFLRPSGDDYAVGLVVAKDGILGGVYSWWTSWMSFAFSMFFYDLLVGAPLAHLPPFLVSAVPFLSTVIGVALVSQAFYPGTFKDRFSKFLFVSLAGFFWWIFFKSGEAFDPRLNNFNSIAEGLTHYQTLTGVYIFNVLALLLAYAWLAKQTERDGPPFKTAALFIGLGAGLTHSFIALGFFGFGLVALGRLFFKKRASSSPGLKVDMGLWILFCGALVTGVLICHLLSPGHAYRYKEINPDLTISFIRLRELMLFTFKGLMKFFLETYLSRPALFLVLAAVSFSPAFTGNGLKADNIRSGLARTSGSFFLFSLPLAGAARAGDFLIYEAHRNFITDSWWHLVPSTWHVIPATTLAYQAIFFAGLALGGRISARPDCKHIFTPVCFLIMVFSTWTNIMALADIFERESRWRVGPAPTRLCPDIEKEPQRGWFDELNRLRRVPIIREPGSRQPESLQG